MPPRQAPRRGAERTVCLSRDGRSDSVVLTLVADIEGYILLEGVRMSHVGARVQLLRSGLDGREPGQLRS